ncbi:UDP-2,4-diacetamido-2,4,6-trideoxy-beta-L-altropyranose hydrolase [Bradyrhizobium sp. C-145]|uniref:UDP-2,4-diacetamido-2,4, 6-trideoxy-beta-L-altropyranose hydrolase n=1 Tax=Bradyrhizobium sp. C-145 TaxID=574727 RepID=UPI00201B8C28|nr:UDP-2,4-diacetamido-2,4,6-trideoxy-beta-L-altropyranose hydrolase [Bradyrhizobium sp. C-145]UQR60754.1 UDP-2,4-diacetamido-2,4,6-trideoxy-beta-L-altropyranose hydrolase [Bradyrhizobium sp. C-145]
MPGKAPLIAPAIREELTESMNSMKRVIFRVDASVQMGMGHLTRCLTLANILAEGGTASCFLMRSHAAPLAALVQGDGHAVRLLPDPQVPNLEAATSDRSYAHWLPTTWQQDAEQTFQAMEEIGSADWLVVDHYSLDANWESACRREGLRILAIDDLADRPHDCEILLDQNLIQQMETRYRDCVSASCAQLLGPRYALLRPEFLEQRRLLTSRSGEIGRILVCFGGSDPTNDTAKALQAIASLGVPEIAVDVVIGQSNPHAELIVQLLGELPCAEVHRAANNMAELMRRADLSIGAGGGMSWERCCLGLPAVVVDIAANQVGALTALAKAGAALYLGSSASVTAETLAGAIRSLQEDSACVKVLGEAAFALVDGQGSGRVRVELGSRS